MIKAKTPEIPPLATPTMKFPPRIKGREFWIEWMAKQNNWSKGAELGVWKGRTFLHLLKTCPNLSLIGVDLWAAQPDNEGPENYLDWDHARNEQIVREGSKQYGNRAQIKKMTTTEAAETVKDESLDFVFIDADHSSEAVREDILNWAPKIKKGGWILGHDINWPTVRSVVEEVFGNNYVIGADNTWGTKKQ